MLASEGVIQRAARDDRLGKEHTAVTALHRGLREELLPMRRYTFLPPTQVFFTTD
jgi:hypothetical protein